MECMSPLDHLDRVRVQRSNIARIDIDPTDLTLVWRMRVAVFVWLASIPRPRLYWSDPGE